MKAFEQIVFVKNALVTAGFDIFATVVVVWIVVFDAFDVREIVFDVSVVVGVVVIVVIRPRIFFARDGK